MGNEKPEDFKEVTASQKSTIEAQDAKWVRPPQSFIDEWNSVGCDFKFNEQTGYFEGNTIVDMPYTQALAVMKTKPSLTTAPLDYDSYCVRTNIPHPTLFARKPGSLCFRNLMEVVRLSTSSVIDYDFNNLHNKFSEAINLHTLLPTFRITMFGGLTPSATFWWGNCTKLKSFKFHLVNFNMNARYCPLIDLDSWLTAVKNRTGDAVIKFTVHADVMAKLTGDTTNAACAALTDEERTQWADLLTLAASKNIQFATA